MKVGNIHLDVQQYADKRWGFDYKPPGGERIKVRLLTKAKALSRAAETATLLANGRSNRAGEADDKTWLQFIEWKAAREKSIPVTQAREEFIKLKNPKSSRHGKAVALDLIIFENFIGGTQSIATVSALDIQRFLDSRSVGNRRKFNLRAQIISLFRWARRMSYLPDQTTEAEKVDPIAKVAGRPNVLTPEQLQICLDNVLPAYLPWLCIGAFSGIRTEEIAPDRKSKKSPLMWEDFDWQHKIIVVREETAKTRMEREVPISDNLLEWLEPYRSAKGPVMGDCPRQPNDRETARLGVLIGGWKHNCLRDSFCSYRGRITQNIPQVSYEMGNSIAMVKRSYHRRQPIKPAEQWFNIWPGRGGGKVISFPKPSHVEICVQQYADGRWGFDDYSSGKRVRVRLGSKQKAEQRAAGADQRQQLIGTPEIVTR